MATGAACRPVTAVLTFQIMFGRFSILTHVQVTPRRASNMAASPAFDDQARPWLSVSGSLPQLSAHINEAKIHALASIIRRLQHDSSAPPSAKAETKNNGTLFVDGKFNLNFVNLI